MIHWSGGDCVYRGRNRQAFDDRAGFGMRDGDTAAVFEAVSDELSALPFSGLAAL